MSQQQPQPAAAPVVQKDPMLPTGLPLLDHFAKQSGLGADRFAEVLDATVTCDGARMEGGRLSPFQWKLLEVAKKYDLDPTLKMLYLMKTKEGPQVVISVDGWLHIMHRHPEYLAHDIIINEVPAGDELPPAMEAIGTRVVSITCRLYTRKREAMKLGPYLHTEYMRECFNGNRKTRDGSSFKGPWDTHPVRMLTHRAAMQAVRYELGVYVPDADEFARAGLLLDDVLERTERGEARSDTRAVPKVPIPGALRAPSSLAGSRIDLPPPPQEIDTFNEPPAAAPTPAVPELERIAGPPPSDLPDPESEEGKRLARELDEQAVRESQGKLDLE